MNRIISFLIIWLLADIYLFQAVKTMTPNRYILWAFWLYEGLVASMVVYYFINGKLIVSLPKGVYWSFILLSLLPKLIVIPFLLLEDIGRICSSLLKHMLVSTIREEQLPRIT